MLRSTLVRQLRASRLTVSARHRCFSYSAYEYPLATEAPEVSQTSAEEARKQQRSSSPLTTIRTVYEGESGDPFDDNQSLSSTEVKEIRELQQKLLPTDLDKKWSVNASVPAHVPPNVPSDQLEAPETLTTTLDNGVRVVSQETYGQVSTVGVVSSVGSRQERSVQGLANMLEVLAFGSTAQYTAPEVTALLQDLGGQNFCHTNREQSLHCIDLLRPNVERALDLLQQVLLHPKFTAEEVLDASRTLEFQSMELLPEFLIVEALQEAAYGKDQQLGRPHYASDHTSITPDDVHRFWQDQFVQRPENLVVAGAGVRHEFLVDKATELFGNLRQGSGHQEAVPSVYRGGSTKVQLDPSDAAQDADKGKFVRLAVAFEVGGWSSEDFVATCVLQTLLGGGSSFSAGGPGKGMYSRLYRQVLNQYKWAEAAEAYTTFHQESGLWGISGSTTPQNARDMVQVFTEHLARLAVDVVSDEELDRARNMLKCNVLTQLESRLILFEDMGRQVLTYGYREPIHETCEKIDAVTPDDLRQVAVKALQRPPTLAAVGKDLQHVPSHHEVVNWLS